MTISAGPLGRLVSRVRPGLFVLVLAVLLVAGIEPVAGPAYRAPVAPLEHADAEAVGPKSRPNIVVVMTDDQEARSMEVMKHVRRLLADHGTTFTNSFVSYPWCCPSRATFLSGQYAHNHGVLGNRPPDGGHPLFREKETLPVWLGRAGYATAHVGKYLNRYGKANPKHVPPGWQEWYAGVDPSTYRMWNYTLNENGWLKTYGKEGEEDPKQYQTDVLGRKAVDYIRRKAPSEQPFFLSFAPLAPHSEGSRARRPLDPARGTPRPAPRHEGAFADRDLPRGPAFNEENVSDKPWHVQLPHLDQAGIDRITQNHRARLESLLAVDEAVADIVDELKNSGELDNTLIVYTSDNGWLQGEHRISCCKNQPYDASSRVPLILRGPGVVPDTSSETLVSNVDLAPTLLEVAGAKAAGHVLDGRSLIELTGSANRRELLFETGPKRSGALWYTAIRTPGELYVEHSTGEREFYDLREDPHQLESKHDDPAYAERREELARRLKELRTCRGTDCP
jgi:N-acetylglucosamine-6-sulfatase